MPRNKGRRSWMQYASGALYRLEERKGIEKETRSVNVTPQDDDDASARCFDVIAPILVGAHRAHRVQRDKTSKYRLETKLISARVASRLSRAWLRSIVSKWN